MADVATLIQQLNNADNNVQSEASKALIAIGQAAVTPLIAALPASNGRARMRIVSVLVSIGDVQALPHLLGLINDPDQSVRHVLSTTLGRFAADPRTIPALEKLAQSDPDSGVRSAAAYTLANRIKGVNTLPLLIQQMYDADQFVAMGAIQSVGKQGGDEAVSALLKALTDIDPKCVGVVVMALGSTRSPRAFEPILPFLKSDTPSVRAATATALGEIGDQRAVDTLTPLLNDKQVAYYGERGAPDQTVADLAQEALKKFNVPKKKSWFFGR